MHPKKHLLALAAAALASAVALPASAGERTVVSALPLLPAPADATTPPALLGVPGLKVELKRMPRHDYTEVNAAKAQGYCLVDRENGLSLSDSMTSGSPGGPSVDEMWRVTEKDGKATLERLRFGIVNEDKAWLKSRTSVELVTLADQAGVKVWGLKQPSGDVFVLAKGAMSGRNATKEKTDNEFPMFDFVSSSCAFGAAQLSAKMMAKGAVAQLNGELPPEGEGKAKTVPRFAIDISAVKTLRDPEMTLSVRVRRIEQ